MKKKKEKASKSIVKTISARRRRLDQIERTLGDLTANFIETSKRVEKIYSTMMELTRANNAVTVVVRCMESHLDEVSPGWDNGTRAEVEGRAARLRRRAQLAGQAQKGFDSVSAALEAARELLELAKRLDTLGADVPLILSIYLQAGEIDAAERCLEEFDASGAQPPEETREVLLALKARIAEYRAEKAGAE